MGWLSLETRNKVIVMKKNGYPVSEIQERLSQEGMIISKVSLYALVKKFETTKLVIDINPLGPIAINARTGRGRN